MKAVVITGGDIPAFGQVRGLIAQAELILCADGAVEWAQDNGVAFDVLIGDMDSASRQAIRLAEEMGAEVICFPSEKDETDTEAACKHAIGKGADEIHLVGGSGQRLDHTLGNLHVLAGLARQGVSCSLEGCTERIVAFTTEARLQGKGRTFSLIPFGGDVHVKFIHGAKYPLENQPLPSGCSLGISNEIQDDEAHIMLEQGCVLAILNRE